MKCALVPSQRWEAAAGRGALFHTSLRALPQRTRQQLAGAVGRRLPCDDGVEATELHTHRAAVDKVRNAAPLFPVVPRPYRPFASRRRTARRLIQRTLASPSAADQCYAACCAGWGGVPLSRHRQRHPRCGGYALQVLPRAPGPGPQRCDHTPRWRKHCSWKPCRSVAQAGASIGPVWRLRGL